MSSNPLLSFGGLERLNTNQHFSYDFNALEEFFKEILEPESMSVFLEEVEEQYISYLLKFPQQPGETAEHQVYYLRKFRKALNLVKMAR